VITMCVRCKSQKIVSKRVTFEGSARALCSDCLHANAAAKRSGAAATTADSKWLHGPHTNGSYPREEAGVRS